MMRKTKGKVQQTISEEITTMVDKATTTMAISRKDHMAMVTRTWWLMPIPGLNDPGGMKASKTIMGIPITTITSEAHLPLVELSGCHALITAG